VRRSDGEGGGERGLDYHAAVDLMRFSARRIIATDEAKSKRRTKSNPRPRS
jgi:hypothetical protein